MTFTPAFAWKVDLVQRAFETRINQQPFSAKTFERIRIKDVNVTGLAYGELVVCCAIISGLMLFNKSIEISRFHGAVCS